MLKRIEYSLEKTLFNSRWILPPFYLGLVLGIILLFIKFAQKLVYMFTSVIAASVSDVIVDILVLVDIALVASLLLIIIFSGYKIFVSKIDIGEHHDRPS
ncbi:YqhA family protein [Psychrobacter sp. HII-4]|uniref:YqhA family protein n=1 Tax=Psychrobacter sp. HII-4 TaxID=1569264 RepID=UPI002234105A|nr:YqhA family protein [Psychrobacter sp. HII-4]